MGDIYSFTPLPVPDGLLMFILNNLQGNSISSEPEPPGLPLQHFLYTGKSAPSDSLASGEPAIAFGELFAGSSRP